MDWVQTPFLGVVSRVWAMGLTFADHVRETGEKADAPVVFAKTCRPSLGGGHLHLPSQDALAQALFAVSPARQQRLAARRSSWPVLLDYEVELGMVLLDDWQIGQSMPRIGYVLVNDLTARSIQIAGLGVDDPAPYWSAAKGFVGFLPMSSRMGCPSEAEADAWPDTNLSTRVNGQLRQHAPPTQHALHTLAGVGSCGRPCTRPLLDATRCGADRHPRRHCFASAQVEAALGQLLAL